MNRWFYEKTISLSNRFLTPIRRKLYGNYTVAPFEAKHLANCINLPTRIDLLHHLPKNGVVAEIGVSKGAFAEKILQITNPKKLYLIDIWEKPFSPPAFMEPVKERFKDQINSGQVEILKGDAVTILQNFEDNFFDWVYIDTDHRLEQITKELSVIPPKIKHTGIIAGHDYSQGNWIGGIRYGIKEAVRSFCLKENWELIYLTHELKNEASFAIRKMEA